MVRYVAKANLRTRGGARPGGRVTEYPWADETEIVKSRE